MSTSFANHVATPRVLGVPVTSVHRTIPGREKEMVSNSSGAKVFEVSPFDHLLRFLILGTEGGTYYADEEKHTYQAFESLKECIFQDATRTVDLIVDVSQKGRAANNDPALFALASVMAFADTEGKLYARQNLPKVARIGTHLFHFAEFIDKLKGWGSGTRKAFQQWYLSKTPDEIAFQYVKYGQRDGWSHRDILRKAHPYSSDERMNGVFNVIANPGKEGMLTNESPKILIENSIIKIPGISLRTVLDAIERTNLPREAVPTEFLNSPKVWEALLPKMKPEAMIRNLGKMTNIDFLAPLSDSTKYVTQVLTDPVMLKQARIHPLNIIKALNVYRSGKGLKGSLTWKPVRAISDALEAAFYLAFDFVEPSGKKILLGLDVSGSMNGNMVKGAVNLTCREAAAIMALVTAKTEPEYHIMAFSKGFIPLDISKNDSLITAQQKMLALPFDTTKISEPMEWAMRNNVPVDCFQVYTDNETNVAGVHPSQALKVYRAKMGLRRTKLAVVTLMASKFTVADPKDPFMQDFVGFDTNAPQAMAELAKM
jgi:60 kDa SS-A/Ro ribonucleoprotein